MKIVDVKMAVMGTAWRNLTFVRVLTDEGVEGVGEVRMLNHTDALLGYFAEAMPNHILGHDPTNIEDLVHRMYMNDYARAGEIAMSAIATIEIACWDIMGKLLAQPIYKLLGGAVRDKIKAYANGWYTVERTPQEFHAAAASLKGVTVRSSSIPLVRASMNLTVTRNCRRLPWWRRCATPLGQMRNCWSRCTGASTPPPL
jgi:L-alanine-DL-glutamate epimerase-like enolase superfamily enzyme